MKRKKTAGILLAAAAAAMLGGCIPQADSQTAAETAQEGETAAEVTVNNGRMNCTLNSICVLKF